ncbi:MAG: hydantoinase B/oxoprolinase family protein [Acidimicrobiales bacterium]
MLTSTLPVRFALDFLGADEFREGDVFVANDPYHGGGHLPDYNVFAPVFADDPATGGRRMVLIASIQCHHGDTGGAVPGGYNVTANDVWGEGVRWPVLKVVDRGVERRDVLYAMQANNRIPDYIGDLRAQIGSAQLAVERLGGLLERWGPATVEESVDYMIDYAARRFREEVASWPDGTFAADTWVDHDPLGHPDIHLHVAITIDGDRLAIDFTGTDDRPELQAWSTFGNTRGYTVGQIAAMMDPEIPKNEGFFEQIQLTVPQAACSTRPPARPSAPAPITPAPRSARSSPWPCSTAARQGGAAGLQDRHPHRHRRRRPHDGPAVHRPLGRGVRRLVQRRQRHGRLGVPGRRLRQPVEGDRRDQREPVPARPVEPRLPHRPGGPGQWRGLCGSHYVKEVRVDAKVYTYVVGMRYPMPGIAGGGSGAPNRLTIRWASDDPYVVEHTADWCRSPPARRSTTTTAAGRLGRPAPPRPAGRARRRAGRVRVGGRGRARLRRRAHRLARGPGPSPSTTAPPRRWRPAASRARRRTDGAGGSD